MLICQVRPRCVSSVRLEWDVEGTVREAWMGCMSGGQWNGVGSLQF